MPASATRPPRLSEQRGGPRTGTRWSFAPLRASQSCSEGSASPYPALGCAFPCKWMVQRKEKSVCKLSGAGRKSQAVGCRDCCSNHYAAQTRVQPRAEIWAKTTSEEVWLAVASLCHAQVSGGLLSASGGRAKPPPAPATSPLQPTLPEMLPNPLLSSGASSSRGAQGLTRAKALPWGERSSTLHHPLFSSPLLLLSLPKARPLGLPERGGRRGWTSCQA